MRSRRSDEQRVEAKTSLAYIASSSMGGQKLRKAVCLYAIEEIRVGGKGQDLKEAKEEVAKEAGRS